MHNDMSISANSQNSHIMYMYNYYCYRFDMNNGGVAKYSYSK